MASVTLPAGGSSVTLDAGTVDNSLFVTNTGSEKCAIHPQRILLWPGQSLTVTVNPGVPVTATSVNGTSLSYTAGAEGQPGTQQSATFAPRQSFYPETYGAKGDLTTDDTAAIQAACDAASTVGGTVVAAGTYLVSMRANVPQANSSTAIVLKSGVTFHIPRGGLIKLAANQAGVGSAGGTIFRNQNPFLGSVFPMVGDHDIAITGEGVIDGNSANQATVPSYGGTTPTGTTATNVYCGIRFDSASRVGVTGVTIKNVRGVGAGGNITGSSPATLGETLALAFYRCGDFWANKVRVYGDDGGEIATGIGANFSTVGRVSDCTVHHLTYGAGFTFYDSADINVTNCHSYLNGGHGFLTEYSHDIFFDGCYAGGLASNDDRSTNKVAVYSSDPGVAVSVGPATGGTFTLTIGGQTTSALAYNASAATVLAAVVALSSVGAGNATVTAGTPTGTTATYSNWDITLTNAAAGQAITGASSLTAGIFRIIPHVILGNGQDTANSYTAGFAIDTGNRITMRGGMSAYNGNRVATTAGSGVKLIGTLLTTTRILVDKLRVFGNNTGIDVTAGDGAAAANARARVMLVTRPDLVGPNKSQTDAASAQEYGFAAGSMTVGSGTINAFLLPAVPTSTTVLSNPFPFDCLVNVIGGASYTDVTVAPGGAAPGSGVALGAKRWVKVPAGGSIKLTYTSTAPTWAWYTGLDVPAGHATSADLAASLADETGSGSAVFGTAPQIDSATGLGTQRIAVVTNDITISAQTTLQNATGLVVPVSASATEKWWFEAYLILVGANATMDYKVGFAVPASATMLWAALNNVASNMSAWGFAATGAALNALTTESGTLSGGTGTTSTIGTSVAGVINGGGTAGSAQLQFAQNTSDAGALVLKAGSVLKYTKIAA